MDGDGSIKTPTTSSCELFSIDYKDNMIDSTSHNLHKITLSLIPKKLFIALWDSYFWLYGVGPIMLQPSLYASCSIILQGLKLFAQLRREKFKFVCIVVEVQDAGLGCSTDSCGSVCVSGTWVVAANPWKESTRRFFEHEDKCGCHFCAYHSLWFVSYFISYRSSCPSLRLES